MTTDTVTFRVSVNDEFTRIILGDNNESDLTITMTNPDALALANLILSVQAQHEGIGVMRQ